MNSDSVSVVIPTYNGAQFIREAVDSVFAQTLQPQEIVVVDDCSSDDTRTIVQNLASKSRVPFQLITLQKNSGGPAGPINAGIAATKGKFIAVLDQDDVFLKETLESHSSILKINPAVSVVFSWCGRLATPDTAIQSLRLREQLLATGERAQGFYRLTGEWMLRALLANGNFVIGYPGFMFRREDWKRKGGVAERLLIASDYEFLAWLCRNRESALVPKIGYLRREHADNACHRRTQMNFECASVQAGILLANPSLRTDADLIAAVRTYIRSLAFWFREAGYYQRSLQLSWLSIRACGLSADDVKAVVKLPLHKMYRTLFRIPPAVSGYTSDLVRSDAINSI